MKTKEMITNYQRTLKSKDYTDVIIDESKLTNLKKIGYGYGTFEVSYDNYTYTCDLDSFKIRDYGLFTPKYRFEDLIFSNEELKQYFIIKYKKVVLYLKKEPINSECNIPNSWTKEYLDYRADRDLIPFGYKWIDHSEIISDINERGYFYYIELKNGSSYEFKYKDSASGYILLVSVDCLLYTIIPVSEIDRSVDFLKKQRNESQIPLRDKILESLNKK